MTKEEVIFLLENLFNDESGDYDFIMWQLDKLINELKNAIT